MDLGIPRDWANWISAHIGFELVIPVFYAWIAGGVLAAITIADMAAIPKATWRGAGYPVRALRWAARIGFFVVPAGLAVSLL